MKKRIVILVSGNGTNAQAILDHCKDASINGEVVALISNRPQAYALERARCAHIPTFVIDHTKFDSRESFDKALQEKLTQLYPDLIVLAGFMRILSEQLVKAFNGKMLNIHPSLLPKYKGLHTHKRALDNHDQYHGASVHFVSAELDGGAVVVQSRIEIKKQDTIDSLAHRVAQTEWKIYPMAVAWFCDDRLQLRNNQLLLDNNTLPESGQIYEYNEY